MSWFSTNILQQHFVREQCFGKLKEMNKALCVAGRVGQKPSAKASILIPILANQDQVSLLYTMRAPRQLTQSGQVTFPGGLCEENESPVQTALRKCKADIGLPGNKVEVWGWGPEFIGLSGNFMVVPVIGVIKSLNPNILNVNQKNISEVIAISLESLCEKNNQFHTHLKNGVNLPMFRVEGYKIWGITAYFTHAILSSLLPPKIYNQDWTNKTPTALESDDDLI